MDNEIFFTYFCESSNGVGFRQYLCANKYQLAPEFLYLNCEYGMLLLKRADHHKFLARYRLGNIFVVPTLLQDGVPARGILHSTNIYPIYVVVCQYFSFLQ